MKTCKKRIMLLLAMSSLMISACVPLSQDSDTETRFPQTTEVTTQTELISIENEKEENCVQTEPFSLENIAEYEGIPYVEVNGNVPFFTEDDITEEPFEIYSDLDSLGRCGMAYANICKELMPTEERGTIGQVKPSGWHTVKYPEVISDLFLYNRCHLIGYQLAGENANEKNLITGTRYLNIEGMLPIENQIAEYVKQSGGHVLYRVSPIFEGDNLVASGVLMEALSIEDRGVGLKLCVYAYNVQPGIEIDYATGESKLSENEIPQTAVDLSTVVSEETTSQLPAFQETQEEEYYILNMNSMRFHLPTCDGAKDIKEKNKKEYNGSRKELISEGYVPCKRCNP